MCAQSIVTAGQFCRSGQAKLDFSTISRTPLASKCLANTCDKSKFFRWLRGIHQMGAVTRSGEHRHRENAFRLPGTRSVNSPTSITLENNGKSGTGPAERTVSRGRVAEWKGFEPSKRSPVYSLSRGAPSTTRPPLRGRVYVPSRGVAMPVSPVSRSRRRTSRPDAESRHASGEAPRRTLLLRLRDDPAPRPRRRAPAGLGPQQGKTNA